jgi:RNA polymerase primary sigma factor
MFTTFYNTATGDTHMPATTRHATVRTDNITSYMNQIEAIPRITVEREAELAKLIHNGTDEEKHAAREELICSNLRLVVKIAHDFKRFGMSFADIVAEGNCGLIQAAEKFDPSKGAKFSCYAAWWIKQAIRKAIANTTRTVRIPGGAAQKVIKMEKLRTAFVAQHDREPTNEELAALLGCSLRTLEGLQIADICMYSMDDTVKDGSNTTFGDMLYEETDEDSLKKEAAYQDLDLVKQLLCHFSDREQWVVNHMYGLQGLVLPESLIAQETGLPPSLLREKQLAVINQLKTLVQE